jgi:hypothetical protein
MGKGKNYQRLHSGAILAVVLLAIFMPLFKPPQESLLPETKRIVIFRFLFSKNYRINVPFASTISQIEI